MLFRSRSPTSYSNYSGIYSLPLLDIMTQPVSGNGALVVLLPTNFIQQLRNASSADSAGKLGLNMFFLSLKATSRGFQVSLDSHQDKILINPRCLTAESERFVTPITDRVQKPFLNASSTVDLNSALTGSKWTGIPMDTVTGGKSLTAISRTFNDFGGLVPLQLTFAQLHGTISFLKSRARSYQGQHFSLLVGQEVNSQMIDLIDVRSPMEYKTQAPVLPSKKKSNVGVPSLHVDFKILEDQTIPFLRPLAWALDQVHGDFLISFIPIVPKPGRPAEEYHRPDLWAIANSLRYYKVISWAGGTVLNPKVYIKGTRDSSTYTNAAIIESFLKACMLNVAEAMFNAAACLDTRPSRIVERTAVMTTDSSTLDSFSPLRETGGRYSIIFQDGESATLVYQKDSFSKQAVGFKDAIDYSEEDKMSHRFHRDSFV